MNHPLPNDPAFGGIIIASVIYADGEDQDDGFDRYTVVVLMPESPYYRVMVYRDDTALGESVIEWEESHRNIVPTIIGDEFPFGPDGERLPRKCGYTDMGGDY